MQHEDFNILYSEIMYKERDIIEKFLKDQYDIRYGRQRDKWHFEPHIPMLAQNGDTVYVTDIKLDKDKLVTFIVDYAGEQQAWECFHFAYGELSKVIEALPDASEINKKNAINDLKAITRNYNTIALLQEYPFEFNGQKIIDIEDMGEEGIKFVLDTKNFTLDTTPAVSLRDHINIEVLHRSDEYKKVMEILSLEPNLRKSVDEYDKTHYGLVTFVIDGTDIEFDVSAIQRDDKGNLTIFGADTECEDELITLTEKEIRKEYLAEILKWMKPKYSDIINTYNGHNPELVQKINDAWKNPNCHDRFGDILFALGSRDKQEIQDKFDIVIDCNETAMDNAHEIMEGVCDDVDLQAILLFVRYDYL